MSVHQQQSVRHVRIHITQRIMEPVVHYVHRRSVHHVMHQVEFVQHVQVDIIYQVEVVHHVQVKWLNVRHVQPMEANVQSVIPDMYWPH